MSLSVNKTEHVNKSYHRLFVVFIAIIVFACFLPTLNNGFVWDDEINYTKNFNFRGLSTSHLHWMFTTFHDDNYHPLVWLTSGLDFFFWGMNPASYHLTNLVFHALNGVLFYFLILAFLRQPAAASDGLLGMQIGGLVGALFFAVHPLRVESVAWISTRGDLICGFFYILTIIAYLRMNDKNKTVHRKKWFLLSLLFFILSLLSRAWGITLPLILLILDIYPLRRLAWKEQLIGKHITILTEKIPFVLFASCAAILAVLAKKGSMLILSKHDIIDRIMQSNYGLCFYVWKTIAPIKLSPFYMLNKSFDPMEPKYILCALLVFSITAGLIILRRSMPWALTAWICYIVIVSPLLGFVQSGPQIAADRYTYISCMPFGVLAGAGMLKLCIEWQKKMISITFISAVSSILVCLTALSVLSYRQTKVWHDNRTFWNHVIQLDSANYIAYNNRGVLFKEHEGKLIMALADYNTAIKLNPEYTGVYYNRGVLLEEQGDLAGAIVNYTNVIRLDPKHARAFNNRGGLLKKKGELAGAIADFNTAIRLNPSSLEAYANRGVIRQEQNDIKRAVEDFNKVLEMAPANWPFRTRVQKILDNIRAGIKEQDNQTDFQ